jgi:DedD protein
MGLFSSFSKNKQEASGEDSGYYRAPDDRGDAERAKSKRASNAGGGATRGGRAKEDPVLPEKKRARRRLVGAIALALAVAVGLPMLLDSEPKPLASDIAIQIPSKDKAEPLTPAPVPAAATPAEAAPVAAAPVAAPAPARPIAASPVAAVTAPAAKPHTPPSTLDKGEEFIDLPKPSKAADTHIARAPEPKKPEPKQEFTKPEPKPEHKPEPKPEVKKPEPAKITPPSDDARAMAILEGKPADSATKYVIQVGAFSAQDKVDEVQGKLKAAGIKSFVQKVSTASGELTRVKLGPFASKDEADKAKAKLGKIGLDGKLIPA